MRDCPHSAAPFALLGRVRASSRICGRTSLAKSVMLCTVRSMTLFAKEVLPQIKDLARTRPNNAKGAAE